MGTRRRHNLVVNALAVVGVWILIAAALGYSARVFVGAEGFSLSTDVALSIIGATLVTLGLMALGVDLGAFIQENARSVPEDLAMMGQMCLTGFVGACVLRIIFGLT